MAKKIKNTKSLRKKLLPFCDDFHLIWDEFFKKVMVIEGEMEKATKIEGIEFHAADGGYIGVGNIDRTMPLIFFEDIDKIR